MDRFVVIISIYTNIKSVCYILETNLLYVDYISKKKKKETITKARKGRGRQCCGLKKYRKCFLLPSSLAWISLIALLLSTPIPQSGWHTVQRLIL